MLFLWLLRWSNDFFLLLFLLMCVKLHWCFFLMLNQPCISEINPSHDALSFIICYRIQFTSIIWKDFCLYVCIASFILASRLSWFIKWVGKWSLFSPRKGCIMLVLLLPYMVRQILWWSQVVISSGQLFNYRSISLIVLGLFRFFICFRFNLGQLFF